jgi:LPXTG-motif cell wall-anchored protein
MVNGEEKTATSDKCKGSFKIKDLPKEITVCELATKKIVTIKESEFNPAKYSKNLDDCKEAPKTIEVCEIATKKIVTINESDMDSRYTTDLSKCEEPVVPPELPQTGTTENIVAIVGLGAMIASIAYYAASRRALNQ